MVWYGTVRYLMYCDVDTVPVRYGTVQYGMVWYGTIVHVVRCQYSAGTVRYGTVWYGMVRYFMLYDVGTVPVRYGVGMIQYGVNMIWYGSGWDNTVWYGTVSVHCRSWYIVGTVWSGAGTLQVR